MRIAIPYWMERVSPVFDVSKHLLLVDIENSTEVARYDKTICETEVISRAGYLADLRVEVLICGAISKPLELILKAKGIDVIGQVCGTTEEVIQAFLKGSLDDKLFSMPGCNLGSQEFQLTNSLNGNDFRTSGQNMRVAITAQGPNLTSQVEPRFDRARYLIVIDTETEGFIALDNSRNVNATQGSGIQTVKDVVNEGVDAVLTGYVGPEALEALETARVQVFLGAFGAVTGALRELISGQLRCSLN